MFIVIQEVYKQLLEAKRSAGASSFTYTRDPAYEVRVSAFILCSLVGTILRVRPTVANIAL